jgi:Fe-S-cluster containining protein
VTEEEIAAIARQRGEPADETRQLYTRPVGQRRSLREQVNGDCVFYDRAIGCTVYPVRPLQCRTWPFWESNLRTPKEWEQTCRQCPGSGRGNLVSAEEITRRLTLIRL